MELNNLKIVPGSRHLPKRVGLGIGSGMGKTSTRGQKGQGARQGQKVPLGFEGGQLPLYRRLPKHGFKNVNRVEYLVVNLQDLEKHFENDDVVDNIALIEVNLIKNLNKPVKLLGQGSISKKLTVNLQAFSKSAIKAVTDKGGVANVVSLKDARVAAKKEFLEAISSLEGDK